MYGHPRFSLRGSWAFSFSYLPGAAAVSAAATAAVAAVASVAVAGVAAAADDTVAAPDAVPPLPPSFFAGPLFALDPRRRRRWP